MGQRPEVAAAVRPAAGFTLLEVIVTLFVLALAAGLAMPLVGRSTETVQARALVARFSAVLRQAREKAITSGRPHAVVVDPDQHRMTILAGTGEVRETRSLPERVTIEAIPPVALTVRFEPQGTSSGGDFRIATGVVTYRVTVDRVTGRVRSLRE